MGAGLITTLTAMAELHPYEYIYFNALTDTKTPGALGARYDMGNWQLSRRQMLEYLLALYPDDTLRVHLRSLDDTIPLQNKRNRMPLILPQDDRERILISRNPNSADYYIYLENLPKEPLIYSIEAYGSVLGYTLAPKNVEAYRAAYDDVAANGTLLTRSAFNIYIHNGELYYLNADCATQTNRLGSRVFLHIFPVDSADLPADRREQGFATRYFRLNKHASFFDGKCIVRRRLPDYPIARIATGYEGGAAEWRVDIDLAAHAAQALHERIAAGEYGQPVARSDFDVYLRGGVLAYLKEDCDQRDVDGRFLLHIIPADPADLPSASREYGFESMNFRFADHGGRVGDICAASRELPGYAIDRIRTGQFVSGGGWLWDAEFSVGR